MAKGASGTAEIDVLSELPNEDGEKRQDASGSFHIC